jgi:hypothetical protein
MSLRNFILFIILGTVLAWGAWIVVLVGISPTQAGISGFLMFYVTLGAALVGTASLLLAFIRIVVLKRRDVPSREIRTSFRHAALFAVVAVTSLALSANGMLQTWHVIALIAAMSLAETFWAQATHGRR